MKTKYGMQRPFGFVGCTCRCGYRSRHMLKPWTCRSFAMPRVPRHINFLHLRQSIHELGQCFGWPLTEIALRYASPLPIATSPSSSPLFSPLLIYFYWYLAPSSLASFLYFPFFFPPINFRICVLRSRIIGYINPFNKKFLFIDRRI